MYSFLFVAFLFLFNTFFFINASFIFAATGGLPRFRAQARDDQGQPAAEDGPAPGARVAPGQARGRPARAAREVAGKGAAAAAPGAAFGLFFFFFVSATGSPPRKFESRFFFFSSRGAGSALLSLLAFYAEIDSRCVFFPFYSCNMFLRASTKKKRKHDNQDRRVEGSPGRLRGGTVWDR